MAITACFVKFSTSAICLSVKGPDLLANNRDRPHQIVILQHGDDQNRSGAGDIGHRDHVGNPGPVSWSSLGHESGPPDVSQRQSPASSPGYGIIGVCFRKAENSGGYCDRRRFVRLAVPYIHRAEIRSANPRGIFEHLVEYRRQLARRRTDNLKDFRRCGLLFERFAQLRPCAVSTLCSRSDIRIPAAAIPCR